ncbi:MAG: hypothetical protein HZA54_09405, partial [Planctomycetes bacterium]|nr:hypothetical protein [Planctomycetota bacterium]
MARPVDARRAAADALRLRLEIERAAGLDPLPVRKPEPLSAPPAAPPAAR